MRIHGPRSIIQTRIDPGNFGPFSIESSVRHLPPSKNILEKFTKRQLPDCFNQAKITIFPFIKNVYPVCAPVGKYHELAG
jgi:hypothetical protein